MKKSTMAIDARMGGGVSVRSAIGRCTHASAGVSRFPEHGCSERNSFRVFSWANSAAHDLKGDALHALRGAEGVLLAGAARYARWVRKAEGQPAFERTADPHQQNRTVRTGPLVD